MISVIVVRRMGSGVFSPGTPPGSVTLDNLINYEFIHLQNGGNDNTYRAVVMNK